MTNVDKYYIMTEIPVVHILWTEKMEYDIAIKSHPASTWNGLYFITIERAGEEKPVYVGINAGDVNTIVNRLKSHKSDKLPQRGFRIYVRIGRIAEKLTRAEYEKILRIVEGALIDSLAHRYKLKNKQMRYRHADECKQFLIVNLDRYTKRPIKFLSRPINSWNQIK